MSELTPAQLDALVSLLDDPDLEVKNHVRDKIISLGAEIIPFLEQKWETSFNPEVQKEIEDLVHDLQFSLVKSRMAEWRGRGAAQIFPAWSVVVGGAQQIV